MGIVNDMDPLFLELLEIALGSKDCFRTAPDPDQWASLYKMARKQSVSGVMALALERLPEWQLPPLEIGRKWMMERGKASSRSALADKRAAELTAFFSEAGYKCCVLKGQGVARLYPDPPSRLSGDIDLWVVGERKKILSLLKGKYKTGRQVYHHVDVHFFDDMPVEVHFHPSFMYNMARNAALQRYFDSEAAAWDMAGGADPGFFYPRPLFDAVFSLSHILKHIINEGVGVRQVMDHHFIMAALPEEDKPKFVATARSLGLAGVGAAMAYVEREIFGGSAVDCVFKPDARRGRRLLDDIEQSGNFGHFDERTGGRTARWRRFITDYPSEILSLPFRQAWEWSWRILNGYVKL